MRLLVVMVWLYACGTAPPPKPTPIEGAGCEAACVRLRELGCEAGKDSPGGASCERVCVDTEAAGVPLNTPCVAGAESCDAVDLCMEGTGG